MASSNEPDAQSTINMSLKDNYTEREQNFFSQVDSYWQRSAGTMIDKLSSFARFVPRQALATFLARKRIFHQIRNIHGHIVECGVFRGGGFFSWSQFSAIFERYNHVRRIVGFPRARSSHSTN